VSTEAVSGPMQEISGLDAVLGKMAWWEGAHEVHSAKAELAGYNGNQFAVKHTMDVTFKETGVRYTMEEVAIYTVTDEKIVHESFFYDMDS